MGVVCIYKNNIGYGHDSVKKVEELDGFFLQKATKKM
jgi:hypothetical protein